MFFNAQSRSTALDTSLNTTWASSSVLPGVSTGNSLDLENATSQSQRISGASESPSTRTPISVPDPTGISRGRIPVSITPPNLQITVIPPEPTGVTRGRTLVTDPVEPIGVTRGRTLVADPVESTGATRGRTLVADPVEPIGVTRGRTLVTDPVESIGVTRGRTLVAEPMPVTRAPVPLSGFNSVAFALTTDPGSTPGAALDLGYIRANSPKTVNDSVSSTDVNDFYRFTVDTDSNLSLRLSGLSADADVEIIRDSNSNGLVDLGEVITRSARGGSSEEVIDLRGLAGRYYARVLSYNGTNNTNYTLSLSAGGGQFGTAPEPNNSLSQAYDIGTLNGNRNFSGFVSSTSDQNDFYRFNLETTSNFKLVLSGLSQDADVEVIQDSNFNGLVEPSEVIKASRLGGNSRESIDLQNLAAGSYSVRVLAYGTTNATNYDLFLLGQPA